MSLRLKRVLAILSLFLIAGVMGIIVTQVEASTTAMTTITPVQDNLEVATAPLERLSWGAILAGAILVLVLQFLLNLLGIGAELSAINPAPDEDSADPQTLSISAILWIGVSGLLAMFFGGWVAAYFSGALETTTGTLHGLMVWAVATLVTIVLLSFGVGRIVGGIAGLVANILDLIGSLTGTAAKATAQTAKGAGQLAGDALSTLGEGARQAAQTTAEGISSTSQTAIENSPEMRDAIENQDLTYDQIKREAYNLLRDAGVSPETANAEVDAAVDDVKNAAKQAAMHPGQADEIFEKALRRVFRRGDHVINDVDRDSLVKVITQRTDRSEAEVRQALNRWESQYDQARTQVRQTYKEAQARAEENRQQAESRARDIQARTQEKAEKIQNVASHKAMEARMEAEVQARDKAQKALDALSALAMGVAVSLIISAVAAGLGGALGAPEEVPDAPIETSTHQEIGFIE